MRKTPARRERESSCQHATAKLGEDELLHGGVGDQAVIADFLGPAERLDAIEELPEPLTVRADGVAVHRELPHLARFAVDEAQVAGELRIHLLRSQHMDEMDVEAPLEERAHAALVSG